MIGFNIGIGVKIIYSQPICKPKGKLPPEEDVYEALMTEDGGVFYLENGTEYIQLEKDKPLSCFGTGVWRMDGSWFMDDIWKYSLEPQAVETTATDKMLNDKYFNK